MEGAAKQHQVIVTVINAGFDLCSQGVLHHHREHQLSGEINLSLRWVCAPLKLLNHPRHH
ncbi:hypothetical protein YC2023_044026 [Brassica napus]